MIKINVPSLDSVILNFTKLPGIGHKTAQRLSFFLMKLPENEIIEFAESIKNLHKKVHFCKTCHFLAEQEECDFCQSVRRNRNQICVVSEIADVIAIERTNDYHGLYHVLGGVLSPLDRIGPDDLNINSLLLRLKDIEEVIIALPASTAGESTAIYISRLLHPRGVKVSRIARGIPMGAQLDYIDEVTMARAMEGRSEI